MHNELDIDKHKKYFLKHLKELPYLYEDYDSVRLMILFFILSGLNILYEDEFDRIIKESRDNIIEWIYKLKISKNNTLGFCGSVNNIYNNNNDNSIVYDLPHISHTYLAILILLILKDDLKRINYFQIYNLLSNSQLDNGCFQAQILDGSEQDIRCCYCAIVICYLLNGWKYIDYDQLVLYVISCMNYDGGFGEKSGCESHGGITYCATSILLLVMEYDTTVYERLNIDINKILYNISNFVMGLYNNDGGFCGRINKKSDTCYAFWNCSTIIQLGYSHYINKDSLVTFLLSNQHPTYGGFTKDPTSIYPDIYHTFLSLCSYKMLTTNNTNIIHVNTMLVQSAYNYWKNLKSH